MFTLSGHVRARHARQQDEFWRRVNRHLGELDLRDNERLCAVALVKRLFPKKLRTGRRRFMSAPCPGYNA